MGRAISISRFYNRFKRGLYQCFHQKQRHIGFEFGVVSFTFDDFPASAFHVGSRLLEEYGWRGTFYLAPGLLQTDSFMGEMCSLENVETLFKKEHEIANHTFSHLRCNGAARSDLIREYKASAAVLNRFGTDRSFAFPYGDFDAASLSFFSGRFDTIRTVKHGINSHKTDLNLLRANPIYQSTELDIIHALIKKTKSSGGWLIFYTHDICPDPSKFGCTEERFKTILSWVKEADLAVHTVGKSYRLLDALDRVDPVP